MRKLLYTVALFVMASACSTKPESKPYNWEDDLYQRLLTDFCMTESQVKDYIRKYIPDVTDEQMRQWEASKALECMMLDGENAISAMPDLICFVWTPLAMTSR